MFIPGDFISQNLPAEYASRCPGYIHPSCAIEEDSVENTEYTHPPCSIEENSVQKPKRSRGFKARYINRICEEYCNSSPNEQQQQAANIIKWLNNKETIRDIDHYIYVSSNDGLFKLLRLLYKHDQKQVVKILQLMQSKGRSFFNMLDGVNRDELRELLSLMQEISKNPIQKEGRSKKGSMDSPLVEHVLRRNRQALLDFFVYLDRDTRFCDDYKKEIACDFARQIFDIISSIQDRSLQEMIVRKWVFMHAENLDINEIFWDELEEKLEEKFDIEIKHKNHRILPMKIRVTKKDLEQSVQNEEYLSDDSGWKRNDDSSNSSSENSGSGSSGSEFSGSGSSDSELSGSVSSGSELSGSGSPGSELSGSGSPGNKNSSATTPKSFASRILRDGRLETDL